jgi:hypothetical protein
MLLTSLNICLDWSSLGGKPLSLAQYTPFVNKVTFRIFFKYLLEAAPLKDFLRSRRVKAFPGLERDWEASKRVPDGRERAVNRLGFAENLAPDEPGPPPGPDWALSLLEGPFLAHPNTPYPLRWFSIWAS